MLLASTFRYCSFPRRCEWSNGLLDDGILVSLPAQAIRVIQGNGIHPANECGASVIHINFRNERRETGARISRSQKDSIDIGVWNWDLEKQVPKNAPRIGLIYMYMHVLQAS